MVAHSLIRPFGAILGQDEALQRVLREAERAAASDVAVLVTGETGTGKEALARAIHSASRRRDRSFVTVDCASLHPGLLQSELFGHRRHAFTGAERERVGRFEAASGGTLFFDRIDEMDPASQAQLLRAIEEREVVPLGEAVPRAVDFRLITSAGPGLRQRAASGRFRADLYYRVQVVELELPSLRERRGDLRLLADSFLADCARRFQKPLRGFSPAAWSVIVGLDWPGNVRQLMAVVEAAAAGARGELIQESDLPVYVRTVRVRTSAARTEAATSPGGRAPVAASSSRSAEAVTGRFADRVEAFQRRLIVEALGRSLWSHAEAARELGLERHQLKYLCAKLGVRRTSV